MAFAEPAAHMRGADPQNPMPDFGEKYQALPGSPPRGNITRDARTILGAFGITLEYHAMRHAANLESVDTYEGTYDVHTLILGCDITGLAPFGAAMS